MCLTDRNYKIVNSCSSCRFLLEDFDNYLIYGCSYNVWEYKGRYKQGTTKFRIDVPKLKTGKTYVTVLTEIVELTGVCDRYERLTINEWEIE